MIKSKFIEVLKTFSKDDYVKFGQFLNSDYFNSSLMIRNMYKSILKYSGDFSDENFTKVNIFKELYPGKTYRETTILTLLSRIYKLCEDYIAQELYNTDLFCKERYLLKGLGYRNLQKLFLKCFEQARGKLKKLKIQNEDYFNYCYELDVEYVANTTAERINFKTDIVQACHDKMIDFVLVKILTTYIYMLNQKKYGYEHKFNLTFTDYIVDYIKKNSFEHAPAILIHFNLMMLLKDDDKQYYFRLKELLDSHPDILDGSDKWTTYVCMVNFCETIVESKETNKEFSKEVNDLYRTIIEEKMYLFGNWEPYMHHRLFLNVVQNGLYQEDFDWAEHFIFNYKDELRSEHKVNMYNLCFALYNFYKKDYGKSLESLSKVQSENLSYYMHIKSLTLQNYYELNLYENALSVIDAYKHFLKNNPDILERDKNHHTNFAKIVYQLLKFKFGVNKYNNEKFDMDTIENTGILERRWLMEKIEEIEH